MVPYGGQNTSETMHLWSYYLIIHQVAEGSQGQEILKFDQTFRMYHPIKEEWRHVHAVSTGVLEEDDNRVKYINGIMIDVTEFK